MFEFITTVAAIVVAQLVVFALGFVVFTNEKVALWYTKKVMKVTEKIQDEFDDWI